MPASRWLMMIFVVCITSQVVNAQFTLKGMVVDAGSKKPLPYVNIGIPHKNVGVISHPDGTFTINIPEQYRNDTLTFSMVGYTSISFNINKIGQITQFELKEKISQLNPVTIAGEKLTEERIGIVKYHPIVHFTDASTNQDDIFEIAQLVRLDDKAAKVTSLSLYISEDRKDSGIFRINFYSFDGKRPGNRIFEESIVQTHAIQKGWLKFDLKKYHLYLKGDVVAAIEFIPLEKKTAPIYYEVKLGGSARSFTRPQSQGEWRVPPHHYRMFMTALVSNNRRDKHPENGDEKETLPAVRLYSSFVQDSFSIFIKVPKDYDKRKDSLYPVVYLLDANAYFDQVSDYIKRELSVAPILVGVGYADFVQNDSLRSRDYTYPVALAEDSFAISGGADKFLHFLQQELLPYVDNAYRTDTSNRTIMGHSLGGYFTTFAMEREVLKKRIYFKNFVAASPSLSYYDNYLLKQLGDIPWNTPAPPRTLYITAGGLESDSGDGAPADMKDFIRDMQARKGGAINVKTAIYPNYSHMETAVKTFQDALKWLMEGK
ncbi:alpha/beta hydrolase-fold protein [Chitinophaga sp. RAB17]|uniref:alpha/beta hydrolase-fold protein n=1 Tax=Chitinophaga sp. RAB17 TaxID=3233049 RepID=UPI003F8DE40A